MKDLTNIYQLIEEGMGIKDLIKFLLDNRDKYSKDEVLLILNKYDIHN